MAWDEWEQIKSAHHDSASTGMRLNQVPAEQGGPPVYGPFAPSFASSPAQKKAAADAIDDHILGDTRAAGKWADEANSAAVKAFGPKDAEGWDAASALKAADKAWDDSVRVLCNRLSSESASLRETRLQFRSDDLGIGTQLGGTSKITGY
ncbi:hypothetical protein [Streptomyces sp. SM10]|uniref:hypothetical protein n=1 Tax=Streptomyces sp. SM10 TaxID=565556 RepID=UPI000CD50A75|nr:hypothetical protein [Streptomyces sp. SM10]